MAISAIEQGQRQRPPRLDSPGAEALRRVERALAELEYWSIEVKVEGAVSIWVLKNVRERIG
jgi:hypothetical protein